MKVYIVVRANNQEFVGVFGDKFSAEKFANVFGVPTDILEEVVRQEPS